MKLAAKVKTALEETRLFILGSQILFGFQLNGIFQDGFDDLAAVPRLMDAAAFLLMALTIGCLIAPSMQHRLVEQGNDSVRIHRVATTLAAVALLPFALSLGLDFFVVLERQTGAGTATFLALLFFALAIFFWFVIERFIAKPEAAMNDREEQTPLHARIEQMLIEARVVVPGAQALLGFQFAIFLTRAFDQLPEISKSIHVAALCLVALSMILLMTPAAIHRISFGGEDSERFHRIGSRYIIAAAVPLGLGIVADMYVAVTRAANSRLGVACCVAILVVLSGLWYVQPLVLRASGKR